MIKSMTGFGRGRSRGMGKIFNVELKAVNHRFNEIHLRMPRVMMVLEEKSRRFIQKFISRGRIDGFFSIENDDEHYGKAHTTVKVDKALAESYYKAIKDLQDFLGLAGKLSIEEIIKFPDVIVLKEPEGDMEKWWPFVQEALEQAVDGLAGMRQAEGKRLYLDLKDRINMISSLNDQIEKRAPLVAENYHQRLEARLQEWLKQSIIDEDRLANEVAIFADRSNITEEIVRLNSHLYQAGEFLEANEPVGRRLDFLVQEMNREINTIGSKASDIAINRLVVEVKSELEKIREQVQNIE